VSLANIHYVWGYITYDVRTFWLPLNDNIDLQKYAQTCGCGTPCHHICGGTWTTDISSMHWKDICL